MKTPSHLPLAALALALLALPVRGGAERSETAADPALEAVLRAATPGPAHRLLAALAGDYRLTATHWLDPAGEPEVSVLPARRELVLGGRALRLEVGPDEGGFAGTGLTGYDNATRQFWYTWADTSSTGLAILRGTLDASGSGRFEGEDPTPEGPAPLVVQVRREGETEVHDYFSPGPDGRPVRWLELRYERR
ncbi:MAG: DUF1579 family protein [Thermoanaerobaculia bacterium]|nr:DUF1579 family protein [Thermoanaerobaculia bacterium]